ncbi:caspase-6-like [Apostichopus japonicus]|uniref:caspase-6-like n=1 Tax=Stichopus japonicus TaxID=307972 RepID=UPI003AB1FA00
METDAGPSRNKRDASIPVITQETDSNKAYFTGSVGSGKKKPVADSNHVTYEDDLPTYKMQHRNPGTALIFNNKTFRYMNDRKGTDRDKRHLKSTLEKLGFRVYEKYNSSSKDIKDTINKMAERDHSNADCFVCVFLTHGDDGVVYGSESKAGDPTTDVRLQEDVFEKFRGKNCGSLIGKPKIFIIQACRGTVYEEPVIEADSATSVDAGTPLPEFEEGTRPTIPSGADFLICYSTSQGFFAFRNVNNGSWYISELCEQLKKFSADEEFTKILTRVHHKVSQRESQSENPDASGKKQMPCFVSMLTKQLFLKPR